MKGWKLYVLMVWICSLVTGCGEDNGTTSPEDTTPSPLASMYPPQNATDVAIDGDITATFKEDMDSLTINETTFTLQYNPFVSGTVTYDKDTRTATFTPDTLLQYGTTYTATITTGATNTSGTPLASNFSWGFKTIIPGEGQVYLARTGQTVRYAAGDDGDFELGAEWPIPRFTDNGDGTVTDELTGLMWLKDGECLGIGIWQGQAYQAIDTLNTVPDNLGCQDYSANHHDWRVPNVNELESLVHAGQQNTSTWLNAVGFTGVQAVYYWTSTTNPQDTRNAWGVNMWNGPVDPLEKSKYRRLWAVRGETSQPALVWKTGQETSYRPNDDGDLQEGASWPSPRFFLHTNNAATTDLLTGLTWLRTGDIPTIGDCTGGLKTWQEAFDYIECLNGYNYAGASDWRLPNRKELFSLIDREQRNPALPSDHYFQDVQLGYYWTSTTYAFGTSQAWVVDTKDGDMGPRDKAGNAWVWPVRGGR